ncbi:hypothetical protein [Crenobacter caeni]|uniref:Uncharacterized protein n=1 Tax=Crenobacter caeni TaxID=2705474 RepID=A0A6B2KSD2_9NEIS|nr:hypothetical protein [Crenobacter caeni]NDV12993.1 hypothetical protein [Crenobacter caeni]
MTRLDFIKLLHNIWLNSDANFSGVGIIVCDTPAYLPIINLRGDLPSISGTVAETLSRLSSDKSKFHDGFHIINQAGLISHFSQYFSPPIVPDVYLDRNRAIGGRFVAGIFGSTIPGVLMTGIVSKRHNLSIFEKGHETHFETLK